MEKQFLCHACASRMATLYNRSLPPKMEQPGGLHSSDEEGTPLLDNTYHPYFTIVQETEQSAKRYLKGKVIPPPREIEEEAEKDEGDDRQKFQNRDGTAKTYYKEKREQYQNSKNEKNNSIANLSGWPSDACEPRYVVSHLCCACFGLYQFLDYIHAPRVAAMVRVSRFFDSTAVSINVNVSRSFSFTWLAAAAYFYDHESPAVDEKGDVAPRKMPPPSMVIPEEYSNFKDVYMLELRVRMLQYLSVPHEDLVTRVSSTLPPPPSSSTKFLGIATYFNEINSQHGGATGSLDDGTSPIKKFKSEDNNNSNTPNKHLIPHALVYSSNNDSITADVFCRYIPSEMLLDTKTVPAVYCSNRPGVVLTFAVILDHVLPFIKETKMYGGEVPARGDEPAPKEESALVQCVVEHANIYLIGNYCKLMRYLSQSPWFSDGERIGTYSLQEVIANPILPFFFPEGVTPLPPVAYADQFRDAAGMDDDAIIQSITRKCMGKLPPGQASAWQSVDPALVGYQRVYGYGRYKFHSAGREDVDVRMLGTGRPFVLEIVSPSREQYTPEDLTRLQEAVNANHSGGVAVRDLRTTDSLITVRLARHSESKVKRYRAVVWCSRPIPNPDEDEHFLKANQIKDLSIEQKTPLRVLHRRSLHARPRMIHSLTLTPINPHWFVLDVETQAGTYVKEFVHGDMGRTVPNLGMLLQGKTDIIQLDVVDMAIQDLEK